MRVEVSLAPLMLLAPSQGLGLLDLRALQLQCPMLLLWFSEKILNTFCSGINNQSSK